MSELGLVRLHFQGSPAPVPRTTLEKYSNVILSELRKKPRKEKALRDAVECQVNKQITLLYILESPCHYLRVYDRSASDRYWEIKTITAILTEYGARAEH